MKFTSTVFAATSGSIAGMTFSRNRGGQYTRRRAIPSNPNSESQGIARTNLASAVSIWTNDLTSAQRQAWATYAQATPRLDPLGQQILLSGQQMFIRSCTVRLASGLAPVLDGPTTSGLGPTPQWGADPEVDASLQAIAGTTVTVPEIGTSGNLAIYMSRPVTRSRTAAHETRRWAFMEAPPVADVFTIAGPVPFPVVANQNVRVTAIYLSVDGRISAQAFRDAVVSES
jgi:hypothetical protein